MATAAADSSTTITTNTHSPKFRRVSRPGTSSWPQAVRGKDEAAASPSSPSPSLPPLPAAAGTHAPFLEPSVIPVVVPRPLSPAGECDAAVGCSDQEGSAGNTAVATKGERKSPWSTPSNVSTEAGPVMGAVSWPPLSESARASPKSSSFDSLKNLSNGFVSAPAEQVMPNPLTKPFASSPNLVSSSNNVGFAWQKSFKSSGGGSTTSSSSANGGLVPPSPPTLAEAPQVPSDKPGAPELSPGELPNRHVGNWEPGPRAPQLPSDKPAAPKLSPRELPNRNGGNWEPGPRAGGFLPQAHGRNEHNSGYGGSHRKVNNGGGSHHNFNPRRDQDRGGNEWNSRPNFNGREVQVPLQHRQGPTQRLFLHAPLPGPAPFIIPPSPIRPFGTQIGFPEVPSPIFYVPASPPPPDPIMAMPFVASPLFIAPDPQLSNLLLKQIEYYFSPQNLCKDLFLRRNMNDEGWVPIALIANFNRVKQYTGNIQFILDTVRSSSIVEVQADKIRKRQDWRTWLIPPSTIQFADDAPSPDILLSHMGNLELVETTLQNSAPAPIDCSSSGALHIHNSNGDGIDCINTN